MGHGLDDMHWRVYVYAHHCEKLLAQVFLLSFAPQVGVLCALDCDVMPATRLLTVNNGFNDVAFRGSSSGQRTQPLVGWV